MQVFCCPPYGTVVVHSNSAVTDMDYSSTVLARPVAWIVALTGSC